MFVKSSSTLFCASAIVPSNTELHSELVDPYDLLHLLSGMLLPKLRTITATTYFAGHHDTEWQEQTWRQVEQECKRRRIKLTMIESDLSEVDMDELYGDVGDSEALSTDDSEMSGSRMGANERVSGRAQLYK